MMALFIGKNIIDNLGGCKMFASEWLRVSVIAFGDSWIFFYKVYRKILETTRFISQRDEQRRTMPEEDFLIFSYSNNATGGKEQPMAYDGGWAKGLLKTGQVQFWVTRMVSIFLDSSGQDYHKDEG